MTDLADLVGRLGLRLAPDALAALLTHATKTKLSPAQIVESLCEAEVREREARNLARRYPFARPYLPCACVIADPRVCARTMRRAGGFDVRELAEEDWQSGALVGGGRSGGGGGMAVER